MSTVPSILDHALPSPVETEDSMASVWKRGGVYQCAYRAYDGRRKSVSLGVRDERTAKEIASALVHRNTLVRLGLASPDDLERASRGLSDPSPLVEKWAESIEGSPSHRREQSARVRSFLDDARVAACCSFAAADFVERCVRWLDGKGGAPETRNKRLFAVRSFGQWLRQRGYIAVNKAEDVPASKADGIRRQPHRALTPAEASLLWAGERGAYYRFRCILGVRGNECLRLTRADVDLGDHPTVTIIGKNKLVVTLPLPPGVADHLRDAAEMVAPTMPLFPGVARTRSARRQQWLADRDAAGLPPEVNERSLRMTCVTWLRTMGADSLDILTIRRDRGRGAESLAAHNYSDGSQVATRIRRVLTELEGWSTRESVRRERLA